MWKKRQIFRWNHAVSAFVGGVFTRRKNSSGTYCRGLGWDEGEGSTIISADDISAHVEWRKLCIGFITMRVAPSPGAPVPQTPPAPSGGGVATRESVQYVAIRLGRRRLSGIAWLSRVMEIVLPWGYGHKLVFR